MELLLIRHGLPGREQETRNGHSRDPGLGPKGMQQAERMAEAVHGGLYGRVTALYSSPMLRARETAQPLAQRMGIDATVEPLLAELDEGAIDYAHGFQLHPSRIELWDALNEGRFGTHRFDPRKFSARVVSGMEKVIAANPSGLVAVVCHGGVISAYLSHIIGAAKIFFVLSDYTAVSRVMANVDGYREMLSANERGHIIASPAPVGH